MKSVSGHVSPPGPSLIHHMQGGTGSRERYPGRHRQTGSPWTFHRQGALGWTSSPPRFHSHARLDHPSSNRMETLSRQLTTGTRLVAWTWANALSLEHSDATTHLCCVWERICPHNDRVDWVRAPDSPRTRTTDHRTRFSYPIGGDPRSPALLALCLPCVTRAMDRDEPRWRAMPRGVSKRVCARWHDVERLF